MPKHSFSSDLALGIKAQIQTLKEKYQNHKYEQAYWLLADVIAKVEPFSSYQFQRLQTEQDVSLPAQGKMTSEVRLTIYELIRKGYSDVHYKEIDRAYRNFCWASLALRPYAGITQNELGTLESQTGDSFYSRERVGAVVNELIRGELDESVEVEIGAD